MQPYEFYKGIYLGKALKDREDFEKAFCLCLSLLKHATGQRNETDLSDHTVLRGLCHGAELLKPLLKNPFVTEETFDGYTLKANYGDLYKRVLQVLMLYLPQSLFYRGI